MKKDRKERRAAAALFLLYAALMLAILFLRAPRGTGGWNLTPLHSIRVYCRILFTGGWSEELRRYAWLNFLGNLLLFLPLGVFLPLLFERQRRFALFLLSVFALIIIIEGIQYLTALGSLDVDDLILNLSGAALGFGLWRLQGKTAKTG